jgi:D-alanyl-D-alanine carboxypeptidase
MQKCKYYVIILSVKVCVIRGNSMERTWKENYSDKTKIKVNKHKQLRHLIMLWYNIVIGLYNVGYYLTHNSKKLVSVLTVAIFFIISSSFSFVGENEFEENKSNDKWAEIQENYEYIPTVLNDEDDWLEEYGEDEEENDIQFSVDDILAEVDEETDIIETESEVADVEVSSLSKDDWQLILVNKQHPIPEDYTFSSEVIKGSMKCDARIITELRKMMKAAQEDGINLVVSSSYRDYDRQTYVFNRKIDYYIEKGYSYLEAYKLASITVTVPDASEHQIGLALDITSTTYSELEVEFGDTKAGKWLAAHCAEYGFILRYPLGKEDITGIQYEPWHFRYVGKTAATEIMNRGITLEEFVAELD